MNAFSRVKWIVLDKSVIILMHYPPFNLKNVIQNVRTSHLKPNHRPLWHVLSILNLNERKCVRRNPNFQWKLSFEKCVKIQYLKIQFLDAWAKLWLIWFSDNDSLMMLTVKIKRFEIPSLLEFSQEEFYPERNHF